MADSSKDSASAVPGVIAILLLAAGVLVQQIPLERTRPVTKTKPVELPEGVQTVPARLWQDPIDAARRDWQSLLAKGNSGRKVFNEKSKSFNAEFKKILDQKCGTNP